MEVKLCLVGIGGVGKSAIIVKYVVKVFLEHYDPTIEDILRYHNIPLICSVLRVT